MSKNHGRIRFQLLINSEAVAISGIDSHGVMIASIHWGGNAAEEITPELRAQRGFDEQEWLADRIDAGLHGLDSATEEHVRWLTRDLQPGDEVTVRVLPAGECDPPKRRHRRRDRT